MAYGYRIRIGAVGSQKKGMNYVQLSILPFPAWAVLTAGCRDLDSIYFLLLEDSPPIGLPGKRFDKRFDWKCPNCGRRQERGYPEGELERPYCDTNAKGKSHARIRMIRVAPANKDH
jgi:hypothetical protein